MRGGNLFGATGAFSIGMGAANAGGRKYDGPFGTVYSTNIMPDGDVAARYLKSIPAVTNRIE